MFRHERLVTKMNFSHTVLRHHLLDVSALILNT